jgi:hypothetical protein
MVGDRVRFSRDLGGHLERGRIGLVVELYPDPEDGSKPDLNVLVAIPWIREKVPNPNDQLPWNGRMGGQSVMLRQFHRGFVIPMNADELEFIDNLAGNRG